jgi:2-phospho-L-lactate transferase/gluconeogenesis factor (CofD/UPF0052 family)
MAKRPLRISIFCGGRGAATIIREFLKLPDVELNLLINGYDDGLSTGTIRKFIPGILGPSDFRKNMSRCAKSPEFGLWWEMRLPANATAATLINSNLKPFADYIDAFFGYAGTQAEPFDYSNCAIGNIIFAGAYLLSDRKFNLALSDLAQFIDPRVNIFNITNGENRFLAAKKANGELLYEERAISGPQSKSKIEEIFLLAKPPKKPADFKSPSAAPMASVEALNALSRSDMILFAPGTPYSSLYPSYLTEGVGAAVSQSRVRVKALLINLNPDNDTQSETPNDFFANTIRYLNVPNPITHIFCDHSYDQDVTPQSGAIWIMDDYANPNFPLLHNGEVVVRNLLNAWASEKQTGAYL